MIRYSHEMEFERAENPAGGTGVMTYYNLFSPEETGGRTGMFSTITLEPGCVVGEHLHAEEEEIWLILEGDVILKEDGVEYAMGKGDAEFCQRGHRHGIENRTDKPVVFLALVLSLPENIKPQ